MTDDQPPPAAVQIAASALYAAIWNMDGVVDAATADVPAHAALAALARRYAFVDHDEYAYLVAVEKAARAFRDRVGRGMADELDAALDAAPATPGEGA